MKNINIQRNLTIFFIIFSFCHIMINCNGVSDVEKSIGNIKLLIKISYYLFFYYKLWY